MRGIRGLALMLGAAVALAMGGRTGAAESAYVRTSDPVFAITHVKLVDGTGAPARTDMTVVVDHGRIRAVGPSSDTPPPAGAPVVDGAGKTLIPGLVLMHEHMFYPTGRANYTEMLYSFPRLYLAGGVTTMRTAGSTNPYADLNLRDAIGRGEIIGPDIDVTGPYLNAPGLPILKMRAIHSPAEAARMVDYWSDQGVTSFKAYMHLTRAELRRIVETAHRRGRKVTGHLCSITYREAAALGIDNLEHGFAVASDFTPGKTPDVCPDGDAVTRSVAALDPDGPEAMALIRDLVARKVAITSTLTIFETLTPGRPEAPEAARALLIPQVRALYEKTWAAVQAGPDEGRWRTAYPRLMKLERNFVEAGGLLMAGTDPTGYGGVVAGFSSKRQVELLMEAGFTFEQAIRICSLNGAIFEGRQADIGSIAPGKRADMVLIDGDPAARVSDVERMLTVYKAGVGYDSARIIASMAAVVGLN